MQNFALRKRLEDLTEWERLLFPDLNMILEIRVSQNLAKLVGGGGSSNASANSTPLMPSRAFRMPSLK